MCYNYIPVTDNILKSLNTVSLRTTVFKRDPEILKNNFKENYLVFTRDHVFGIKNSVNEDWTNCLSCKIVDIFLITEKEW
jgi:hypothetical protein